MTSPDRSPVTPSRETSAMNRTALRQVVTDKLLIALAGFYAVVTVPYLIAGQLQNAAIWATIFGLLLVGVGFAMWRTNLDALRRRAEDREMAHRHDLRMERLAQEHDVIQEDNRIRAESVRLGLGDPGPGEAAARILADRAARYAQEDLQDRQYRADRQARIAAYEARSLQL